jgi:hypothetical protein
MPSAAITATAWNRLLGHHLSDQLHRPAHRLQLGLQLGDPPLGRDQLALLGAGQARFQAAVDAVLAAPGVDRLVADAKRLGDLGDRPSGLDQVQDLAAELRWIPASSHAAPLVGQHGIQQHDSTELGEDQSRSWSATESN